MRRATIVGMAGTAGLVIAMAGAGAALGQNAPAAAPATPTPPPHAGHDHGSAMAFVEPKGYGEAMRVIGMRIGIVQSMADAGKWAETHDDAEAIASAAKLLGKLALPKESGVARAAVKDVNIRGKAIAEAVGLMHDAADAGKADEAAKYFGRVKTEYGEIAKAAPATYTLSLVPEGGVKTGEVTKFAAALRDPAGAVVQGLEVVHEQPVHMIVVSKGLDWYRHEHPKRNADGTFAMEVSLPTPGEYAVFADFTPTPSAGGAAIGNQVASATVTAPGSPPFVGPKPLKVDTAEVKHAGGLDVRVRCNGGDRSREDTVLRFNFQKDGADVTSFEPYLGAPAHLVIISADGRQYVHAHPVAKGGGAGADVLLAKAAKYGNGKDTDLVFHANLPMSGLYRMFLEFKFAGAVQTVPFTMEVLAMEGGPEHEHDDKQGTKPISQAR